MPDPVQQRGDQARTQIVQAAYRLFISQGYHGTSMRQIAQSAGLALGGIYNHFDSKEAIFSEVLFVYHPLVEMIPEMESMQAASAEEFLRIIALRFSEHMRSRLDFLNLMFIEFVEFRAVHVPVLMEGFIPLVLRLAQRFESWPDQVRPIPGVIQVRAFLGMLFSFVLTDLALQKSPIQGAFPNAFDDIVDIYLHGILVKGKSDD